MKKYDYIIAIDPDCKKSGVAILTIPTKEIQIDPKPFPTLVEFLRVIPSLYPNALVIVEAGWMNKTHFHLKSGDNKRQAGAKGNSVGRNHETGRKIIEMAHHYNVEVIEAKPLKKSWHGSDGKISHDEIAYFIQGFPSRSNQETRDAAVIAWVYAGFPIRVKPIK